MKIIDYAIELKMSVDEEDDVSVKFIGR